MLSSDFTRCCSTKALSLCCSLVAIAGSANSAMAQFNDDCSAATTVNEGLFTFDLSAATAGETPFFLPCTPDRQSVFDQWIRYFATFSGPVSISTVGYSSGDTVLSAHDTSDPNFDCAFAPFQVRACSDDAGGPQSRMIFNVTIGQELLIRVAGALESRPTGSVLIEPYSPLAGDDCASAPEVFEGTNTYDATLAAVNDYTSCRGLRDFYFNYTPTATGALTIQTCGGPTDANISVFQTCGGKILACSRYAECSAGTAVEAGVPVFIRISNDDATGPQQFSISLNPAGLPLNDNCESPAVALLGNTPFDNTYATTQRLLICGSGGFTFASGLDVWFSFTPPSTGTYDISTDQSLVISDTSLAVYDGCDGLDPLACNDDSRGFLSFIRTPLTGGQTYLIQVLGTGLPNAGTPVDRGEGVLTIRESIAPTNDDCASPQLITSPITPYNIYDATTGPQVPTCVPEMQITSSDAWFRYVPASTGPVEARLLRGGSAGSLSAFTTCGDSAPHNASLAYDTAASIDEPRLILNGQAGVPILLRVAYSTLENDPLPPRGDGELYVGAPATPVIPNDPCELALPIGDGEVSINLIGSSKDCRNNTSASFDSCAAPTDNDIFFRYSPTITAPVTITINDGVDYPFYDGLVVSVYDTCGGAPIACSLASGDAPVSTIRFDAATGNDVLIRVGSILRFGSLGIQTGTITIAGGCPCSADFDGSGGTPDATDIDAFFDAWLDGSNLADTDCSGGTPDAGDIDAFFDAWLVGGC
jgi:hypothetical protein